MSEKASEKSEWKKRAEKASGESKWKKQVKKASMNVRQILGINWLLNDLEQVHGYSKDWLKIIWQPGSCLGIVIFIINTLNAVNYLYFRAWVIQPAPSAHTRIQISEHQTHLCNLASFIHIRVRFSKRCTCAHEIRRALQPCDSASIARDSANVAHAYVSEMVTCVSVQARLI